jgi:AraC-like DNA-binding protein
MSTSLVRVAGPDQGRERMRGSPGRDRGDSQTTSRPAGHRRTGTGTAFADASPPVKVFRLDSATARSEFVRGAPDPRLRGLVASRCGYREWAQWPVRRRQPASSLIPVIISFGSRLDVIECVGGKAAGRSYGSFVVGFQPGYAITRFTGTQFGVQVDLTPLGAYRIFGIPGSALAHGTNELEDVAPELTGSFPDRLASLHTWSERLAVIDALLLAMAGRGREPDPLVHWLWNRLHASGGRARISDLVEKSGWSHRYVTARFREQVGVTPKAAAGVIRFERAAAALSAGVPLADAAARYGYADQSHLTREFVRMAGTTPRAYTASPALPWPTADDSSSTSFKTHQSAESNLEA